MSVAEWIAEKDARTGAEFMLASLTDSAIALVDKNEARARDAANRILQSIDDCRSAIEAGQAARAVDAALNAAGIWWRAAYSVHWLDHADMGEKSDAGGVHGGLGGKLRATCYATANAQLARAARGYLAQGWARDEIVSELVLKDLLPTMLKLRRKRGHRAIERVLRKALGPVWTSAPRKRQPNVIKPR